MGATAQSSQKIQNWGLKILGELFFGDWTSRNLDCLGIVRANAKESGGQLIPVRGFMDMFLGTVPGAGTQLVDAYASACLMSQL